MAFKIDIFDLLNKLNSTKSDDIYEKLSSEERKGFAPLIVMRWMSGTSDKQQIMLLNEFTNPYVFSLAKHPRLLMHLLHASSSKTGKRYQWLGIKSKKKNAESLKVVGEYFEMSPLEVSKMSPLPAPEEIIQMAEAIGWQKEDMVKLQKELKA